MLVAWDGHSKIILNQFDILYVSIVILPTWQIPPVSYSRQVKTSTKSYLHILINLDLNCTWILQIQSCWKGEINPVMKSTPKIITVFFFYGIGQSVHICEFLLETKRLCSVMCQQEKNTWTSDSEYGGVFAVAMMPLRVALSGYGHFFLLTTVSTTVKSFECKSSDKRPLCQQSAGTN